MNDLGFDRRHDYAVDTHPAVLDGFINLVRQEIKAREHPLEKNTDKAKDALTSAKEPLPKKKTHSMER